MAWRLGIIMNTFCPQSAASSKSQGLGQLLPTVTWGTGHKLLPSTSYWSPSAYGWWTGSNRFWLGSGNGTLIQAYVPASGRGFRLFRRAEVWHECRSKFGFYWRCLGGWKRAGNGNRRMTRVPIIKSLSSGLAWIWNIDKGRQGYANFSYLISEISNIRPTLRLKMVDSGFNHLLRLRVM